LLTFIRRPARLTVGVSRTLLGDRLDWRLVLDHSCEFHSGTGRNDRNVSYRSLNQYKRASIPYRVKYRSIPVVTACIIFFHVWTLEFKIWNKVIWTCWMTS
jgi:hypothetical protein